MTPTTHAWKQICSRFVSNALLSVFRKDSNLVGQSKFQLTFVVALTLWLVGTVEFIQKAGGQGLDPRFWMMLGLLFTIFNLSQLFRLPSLSAQSTPTPKKPTRADEIANRIHSSGFAVYHDASKTNHDGYVVVGPTGIYALEVKERNVFGSRTIEFGRENELVLGGRIADSRPLKHAQAAAAKIRDGLKGIVTEAPAVKPVVVFLNDWQINQPQDEPNVPVLNENDLPQYLSGQETVLSESEVNRISAYLGQAAFAVVG